jgi:hypothetical protein
MPVQLSGVTCGKTVVARRRPFWCSIAACATRYSYRSGENRAKCSADNANTAYMTKSNSRASRGTLRRHRFLIVASLLRVRDVDVVKLWISSRCSLFMSETRSPFRGLPAVLLELVALGIERFSVSRDLGVRGESSSDGPPEANGAGFTW